MGFLIGLSGPFYLGSLHAASPLSVERVSEKAPTRNFVRGQIQKSGNGFIVVNGQSYQLSPDAKIEGSENNMLLMGKEGPKLSLSEGVSVQFIPSGNVIKEITIIIPQ
jgi:hypothetical protein